MENYEYISTVGEGAYGYVWKCKEKQTERLVAVKGFKQAHEDNAIMRLALREVKILRSISHVNCVKLFEAFKSRSGRVYLIFEYCERNIFQELDLWPNGIPAPQLKLILFQLLQALIHLHSKKIIHRDIKPANILLTANGIVKLCDFGFARTISCQVPKGCQQLSSYVVTRWYRAPEVLVNDAYGPAADVWALGATFAELATGRALFPGKSSMDQLWHIMRSLGPLTSQQVRRLKADPKLSGLKAPSLSRPLRQRLYDVEPRLYELISASLQVDPNLRPSAVELLNMPYFWDVHKHIIGSPLENLYPHVGPLVMMRNIGSLRPSSAAKNASAAAANGKVTSIVPSGVAGATDGTTDLSASKDGDSFSSARAADNLGSGAANDAVSLGSDVPTRLTKAALQGLEMNGLEMEMGSVASSAKKAPPKEPEQQQAVVTASAEEPDGPRRKAPVHFTSDIFECNDEVRAEGASVLDEKGRSAMVSVNSSKPLEPPAGPRERRTTGAAGSTEPSSGLRPETWLSKAITRPPSETTTFVNGQLEHTSSEGRREEQLTAAEPPRVHKAQNEQPYGVVGHATGPGGAGGSSQGLSTRGSGKVRVGANGVITSEGSGMPGSVEALLPTVYVVSSGQSAANRAQHTAAVAGTGVATEPAASTLPHPPDVPRTSSLSNLASGEVEGQDPRYAGGAKAPRSRTVKSEVAESGSLFHPSSSTHQAEPFNAVHSARGQRDAEDDDEQSLSRHWAIPPGDNLDNVAGASATHVPDATEQVVREVQTSLTCAGDQGEAAVSEITAPATSLPHGTAASYGEGAGEGVGNAASAAANSENEAPGTAHGSSPSHETPPKTFSIPHVSRCAEGTRFPRLSIDMDESLMSNAISRARIVHSVSAIGLLPSSRAVFTPHPDSNAGDDDADELDRHLVGPHSTVKPPAAAPMAPLLNKGIGAHGGHDGVNYTKAALSGDVDGSPTGLMPSASINMNPFSHNMSQQEVTSPGVSSPGFPYQLATGSTKSAAHSVPWDRTLSETASQPLTNFPSTHAHHLSHLAPGHATSSKQTPVASSLLSAVNHIQNPRISTSQGAPLNRVFKHSHSMHTNAVSFGGSPAAGGGAPVLRSGTVSQSGVHPGSQSSTGYLPGAPNFQGTGVAGGGGGGGVNGSSSSNIRGGITVSYDASATSSSLAASVNQHGSSSSGTHPVGAGAPQQHLLMPNGGRFPSYRSSFQGVTQHQQLSSQQLNSALSGATSVVNASISSRNSLNSCASVSSTYLEEPSHYLQPTTTFKDLGGFIHGLSRSSQGQPLLAAAIGGIGPSQSFVSSSALGAVEGNNGDSGRGSDAGNAPEEIGGTRHRLSVSGGRSGPVSNPTVTPTLGSGADGQQGTLIPSNFASPSNQAMVSPFQPSILSMPSTAAGGPRFASSSYSGAPTAPPPSTSSSNVSSRQMLSPSNSRAGLAMSLSALPSANIPTLSSGPFSRNFQAPTNSSDGSPSAKMMSGRYSRNHSRLGYVSPTFEHDDEDQLDDGEHEEVSPDTAHHSPSRVSSSSFLRRGPSVTNLSAFAGAPPQIPSGSVSNGNLAIGSINVSLPPLMRRVSTSQGSSRSSMSTGQVSLPRISSGLLGPHGIITAAPSPNTPYNVGSNGGGAPMTAHGSDVSIGGPTALYGSGLHGIESRLSFVSSPSNGTANFHLSSGTLGPSSTSTSFNRSHDAVQSPSSVGPSGPVLAVSSSSQAMSMEASRPNLTTQSKSIELERSGSVKKVKSLGTFISGGLKSIRKVFAGGNAEAGAGGGGNLEKKMSQVKMTSSNSAADKQGDYSAHSGGKGRTLNTNSRQFS